MNENLYVYMDSYLNVCHQLPQILATPTHKQLTTQPLSSIFFVHLLEGETQTPISSHDKYNQQTAKGLNYVTCCVVPGSCPEVVDIVISRKHLPHFLHA